MRYSVGVLAVVLGVLVAGCSTAPPASSGAGGRALQVVAAENVWGSIAAQLGGDRVQVRSIIDNPDADPHDYEATAADGRAFAGADLTLVNGVGYDTWASDLTAANPSATRVDLSVGDLVGLAPDANPHRWYNPEDVVRVADALTQRYSQLDPSGAAYYQAQNAAFPSTGMADYRSALDAVTARYAGTPIGASESIVSMVAPAMRLDLITPPGFLVAISEGVDPTAADKASADQQITSKAIRVYVYNPQNATPDVQTQIRAAQAAGIPVTTMTETMTPAGASWQQWQTTQLRQLLAALDQAGKAVR